MGNMLAIRTAGEAASTQTNVAARRPVRLTRRGRIVLLCFLIGLVGILVALVSAPGEAADQPGPTPTMIVQSGDTLWSIAGRQPSRDRDATIQQIRRLNHLDDYRISAGQRLILPRYR